MDNDSSVILNTCDRRVHGNDRMEEKSRINLFLHCSFKNGLGLKTKLRQLELAVPSLSSSFYLQNMIDYLERRLRTPFASVSRPTSSVVPKSLQRLLLNLFRQPRSSKRGQTPLCLRWKRSNATSGESSGDRKQMGSKHAKYTRNRINPCKYLSNTRAKFRR